MQKATSPRLHRHVWLALIGGATAFALSVRAEELPSAGWVPDHFETVTKPVRPDPQLEQQLPELSGLLPEETNVTVVHFKNGRSLEVSLVEFAYVGQLTTKDKAPYLIFSGRDCVECDMNTSIYIHSPSDGPLSGTKRYSYPGRVRSIENDQVIEDSRMYFGRCLPERGPVAIWFQEAPVAMHAAEMSVYLLEVVGDNLEGGRVASNPPTESTVKAQLPGGACHAVPPKEMHEEL